MLRAAQVAAPFFCDSEVMRISSATLAALIESLADAQ
jgi:hypothetical protein